MLKTDTAHHAWEKRWQTPEGRQDWLRPEADVADYAAALQAHGGRRALDLGCGVGRHSILLAELGWQTSALDGSGSHSPFAEGLLGNMTKSNEELSDVMRAVSLHVRERTEGRQTVWLENSLTKSFYFTAVSPASPPGKVVDLTPPEPDADIGVVFPQSSEELLSEADIAGKDSATLRLARNEIFARNGRIFNDPALQAHFGKFDWYRPETYEPRLNAVETQNVALIRQFEMTQSAPKAGFLFIDSDRRLLTAAELKGLSKAELRNARNEIYARRGRKFVRKEVSNYFKQFDWYRPQFGEVELTFLEAQNVALIQKFEKAP